MYILCLLLISSLAAFAAESKSEVAQRLENAATVLHEIMATPDKGIPEDLLDKANCVVIVPGLKKGAFIVGAQYGKGFVTCRKAGAWSAPAAVKIEGGSVGLQIGAESTDLVLFFMNDRGARSLVNGSRITLGGKASVAAGPFGRSGEAATNLELKSEIYSYARAKGLFAGISLEGSRLAPNKQDIANYYGRGVTYKQLLFGGGPPSMPAEADEFVKTLPEREMAAQ